MVLLLSSFLSGCGGGAGGSTSTAGNAVTDPQSVATATQKFTLSGNVSGLMPGTPVTLKNNAADPIVINANGVFAFPTALAGNGTYSVTVATQPVGEICTVTNGAGAGVVANISNLAVNCSVDTYTVSGSVSGLNSGAQVTLKNNGADPLVINADGAFTFPTTIANKGSYVVTIDTQPIGQICTVSNGTGTLLAVNVANISVICSNQTYTVSVNVAGLAPGTQVTLVNNAYNPSAVTANGTFTFFTPVAYGSSYTVTVGTQPVGQICTVSGATGSNVTANVVGITLLCSNPNQTYTIGGTVTGVTPSAGVLLTNNSSDSVFIQSNGAFQFPTPVAHASSYSVKIASPPAGHICTATNNTGSNVLANVTV